MNTHGIIQDGGIDHGLIDHIILVLIIAPRDVYTLDMVQTDKVDLGVLIRMQIAQLVHSGVVNMTVIVVNVNKN